MTEGKVLAMTPITHDLSPITYYPSPITYHPSPITSYPSPITFHGVSPSRLTIHDLRVLSYKKTLTSFK